MWGGVLADRLDRRKLLLVGQAGQLLGAAAIGVLAATGSASVWSIGIVSLLAGVVGTLTFPSASPRSARASAPSAATSTCALLSLLVLSAARGWRS